MRNFKDQGQIQLILNQLLNYQSKDQSKARDQSGLQIKNLGAGTDPSDAVTMAQISNLAPSDTVPSQAMTDHFYTINWSNQNVVKVGDTIEPFCIINDDRVGQPTALWVAAGTPSGTGTLNINIKMNGNNGKTPVTIFVTDLSLPINQNGPVQQSNFISPLPYFGIGTYLQPVITASGGQAAVAIGMTVKKRREAPLA